MPTIRPQPRCFPRLLAACLLAWTARAGVAQETPPTPPPPETAPAAAVPTVTAVEPGEGGLSDALVVHVDGFAALWQRIQGRCDNVILYLDDAALTGVRGHRCVPEKGEVAFFLVRTDNDDEAWHHLLGKPRGYHRRVRLSVGTADGIALASRVDDFALRLLPRGPFWFFVVLFAVGSVLFVVLVRRSSILRDPYAEPGPDGQAPYSLSRFQMAVWFFLVISAYVFIWLITFELNTIPDSILGLLGIGAGTGFGATMIDGNKVGKEAERKGQLGAEARALDAAVESLAAEPSRTSEVESELAEKKARLAELKAELAAPSKVRKRPGSRGFLRDMLSDSTGVGFHRFQIFAWTIVLGVIFVGTVYVKLSMPDFSATLLGLMGVSSGTYLGFKVPEQQDGSAPPPPGGGSGTKPS